MVKNNSAVQAGEKWRHTMVQRRRTRLQAGVTLVFSSSLWEKPFCLIFVLLVKNTFRTGSAMALLQCSPMP